MSDISMKKMAELLRKGARMLGDSCPECNTPLFQLKSEEIICPVCQKPVKYLSHSHDLEEVIQKGNLESIITNKINEIQGMLQKESNIEQIKKITETLLVLLEARKQVIS
jgi:UPF0148 protein